jgi:hypothetical protein
MYPNWKPKGPGTGGSANGKPNGAAPAGEKKPAPVAGAPLMLKDPLPGDQVDWTKTQQIQYIAGKAIGKNGKRYQWSVRHQ